MIVNRVLDREEIEGVLRRAEEVLSDEPPLLEISADSALVVGDTHGDYETSQSAVRKLGGNSILIFLGDYVDRGAMQIENINFLLKEKIRRPREIFLLRGNHETPTANMYYGFYHAVTSRYSHELYEMYSNVFSQMAYGAVLNSQVICLHGGLPEPLTDLGQISSLPKGERDPRSPIAVQLLWNDPKEGTSGFGQSARGPGIRYFGRDAFEEFMDRNDLSLMIRSHESCPRGYAYLFSKKLLTIFSSRYYGVTPSGALLRDHVVEIVNLSN